MVAVLSIMLATGCGLKKRFDRGHEADFPEHKVEKPIPELEHPTQKYIDPDPGTASANRDITGDYLRVQWEEYIQKRDSIFKSIRVDLASGDDPVKVCERPENDLEALQEGTRNAMKNILNFGDVRGEETFVKDKGSWARLCGRP